MNSARVIKFVFGLVGVLMLIGAGLLYQNTTKFIASASRAQGEVIDLLRVESSRRNSSDTWRPMVHFKLPSGEIIEFTPSSSSSPPAYDKGEIVEVFFNPADPKDARLNGFFDLWGGAAIVGGLGAVFLAFAIGMHFLLSDEASAKRRRPR
ncbi:hypothetical protein J2W30_003767 [Variovorax boronicumulans]|uniref:DUF3592 domain-containing protein n=1 Tax=Variovorax TaxID=34072 RepID=UPI0027834F51|nr:MULTISPECIES: DUF3592 domain-containing protein [Variovorax]MDP9991458.1 hypothetical protein [Variovorax boronicumulans]MDQ0003178.1 hypothetical protein [Variovorax boronicumulans]MDQ0035994.1 hypothetical protein [Variovorax boronicumulans]MDQ0041222.1 hypothetical protein [Variovorax boronicumulans]MDQ0608047.1 hypothetical protein [Variovorax sp. W1I1]